MTYTLRLTQKVTDRDRYSVEVALEGEGVIRQIVTVNFAFTFTAQDQEDFRWYLEDFLQYPLDPAPKVANRIERRMAEIGAEIFEGIFDSGDEARGLWARIGAHLSDTGVEVITEAGGTTSIPWELIRDPATDTFLALQARTFLRKRPGLAETPQPPHSDSATTRILLAICRPERGRDVPFRSVAMRMLDGLHTSGCGSFQVDVLRPPTFQQLCDVLNRAKDEGQPYQIVHFDGHGTYEDLVASTSSTPVRNKLGYLVFESPADPGNAIKIGGKELGGTLLKAGVRLLVMNACRSAHSDPPPAPVDATDAETSAQPNAFGSLADQVLKAGIAGVVAMRYKIYVVTAAQFVAELYAALAQGRTLGEAVTLGRRQLHDQPIRELAFSPRPLQDWLVPVVYEAAPLALFPAPSPTAGPPTSPRGALDNQLPKRPDTGFFGRDETLLALDRLFDTHPLALLHGEAGGGKTSTAVEFARWYATTGGIKGAVLFTSFERHRPLARVLDQLGLAFADLLAEKGIDWLALDEGQRRHVGLQVLALEPVLWIWDNVEPVSGFPAGATSAWSVAEQQELAAFLGEACGTKAKFLLTSRRDERGWLGDLPARVNLPPMPVEERVQFARRLAEEQGHLLSDFEAWQPLLQFTQGNPLTLRVVVNQALRDNLRTRGEIETFVSRLRAGEAVFKDEASEGRSKSLGASLSYGFEHAFAEKERKQLALLHFFQGYVNAISFGLMGRPEYEAYLPELSELDPPACDVLFRRATEVGLLTGRNFSYRIHPALPWFFKGLFEQYYCSPEPTGGGERAARAFVQAMSVLSSHYVLQYTNGDRGVVIMLVPEEDNLLHASKLARTLKWWNRVISLIQGLFVLYEYQGRRLEWSRLLNDILPDFVDPATDKPLPGIGEEWSLVTHYRIQLAKQAHDLTLAKRLQRLRLEWDRERAASALAMPPEALDDAQRQTILTLANSLHQMANLRRELRQPECKSMYEEVIKLFESVGAHRGAFTAAFNLGNTYKDVPELRDLEQAEHWYKKCEALLDPSDKITRANVTGQQALLAYQRATEALDKGVEDPAAALTSGQAEVYIKHISEALRLARLALLLTPPDAVNELAAGNEILGIIYQVLLDHQSALECFSEAILHREKQNDFYSAAAARCRVANILMWQGRFKEARDFAEAALSDYERYGDQAAAEILATRALIERTKRGNLGP